MTRQQHTPEPWAFVQGEEPTHRELVRANTEPGEYDSIAYHGADWNMRDEDAARIVSCVNACAGLNPEAIPALVEAAQKWYDYDKVYREFGNALAQLQGEE